MIGGWSKPCVAESNHTLVVDRDEESFAIEDHLRKNKQFQDVTRKTFRRTGTKVAAVPEPQNLRWVRIMECSITDHKVVHVPGGAGMSFLIQAETGRQQRNRF